MKCPMCENTDTIVKDTRPVSEGKEIKRRRECPNCGNRFTTFERLASIPTIVVKKDGMRQPYEREKIERGLIRACHKRCITSEDMGKLIQRIEQKIFSTEGQSGEIRSEMIGSIVLEELRKVDDVAFIRFASIYNEFENIESFRQELDRISYKKEEKNEIF